MNTFSRGQKGKLADQGLGAAFSVALDLNANGMTIDVSCFGLDAADKLSDERYMVFYNQLAAPNEAVRLDAGAPQARFSVNLGALPPAIVKLVLKGNVATVVQTAMATELKEADGRTEEGVADSDDLVRNGVRPCENSLPPLLEMAFESNCQVVIDRKGVNVAGGR